MTNKPFTQIRHKYNTLSDSQKGIADYILNDKEKSALITISKLAEKCNVSEATVMRFIKKLGYHSFQVFKIEMAHEFSEIYHTQKSVNTLKIEDGYQSISPDDDIETTNGKVIQSAAAAINDLHSLVKPSAIETVVNLFLKADNILFYGSGGSSVIALDGYHKFMRLGLNVSTDQNSHFMLIKSALRTSSDVFVLISHTGESREVLEIAASAKQQGSQIIGITSYINSSLSKISDITLFSSTNQLKYYTDAMISRILQLIILDMIFVSVSLRLGNTGKKSIDNSRNAVSILKKPTSEL